MSATKPVNQDAMPQGGIKVFVRDTLASTRYEVGVIDDPTFEQGGETTDVEYNNWTTKKVINGDLENFTFNMYELRPELLEIINKGLADTVSYDGATTETGYSQTIKSGDWGYDNDGTVMLKLPNTGGVITPTSVTGSVDGALTVTTDYTTAAFGDDYTYIKFVSGTNITTTSQDIVVVYDATPTKGFYESPRNTGIATGFILETEWNGLDSAGDAMKILKIFEDAKPVKPVVTFQGDSDDKGAFVAVDVTATLKTVKYVGFETA